MPNKFLPILAEDFGVDMRCIKSGRPMANGQVESAVKLVKQKLKLRLKALACITPKPKTLSKHVKS